METAAFKSLLREAWEKRAALRARTDAYRLLNGSASGTPGLVVDMFSACAIVYAYDKDLRGRYGDFPHAVAEITGAQSIALKDRAARDESGRADGEDLQGVSPETVKVREGDLSFIVHPRHPRNVGLFLDTRPLRERLAAPSAATGGAPAGRSALNLFSYSCSLGAAAAKGAPGRVVNVDVSSKYLDWGRENYRANGLPEEKGAFVRMDAEEYLDWAARKGMAFDAVVLDPPSFSRAESRSGRGGTYSFARDYPRLLAKCARVAAPGAVIHALTNFAGIGAAEFRARVHDALSGAGRRVADLARVPAAEDFDGPADEGSMIGFSAVLD